MSSYVVDAYQGLGKFWTEKLPTRIRSAASHNRLLTEGAQPREYPFTVSTTLADELLDDGVALLMGAMVVIPFIYLSCRCVKITAPHKIRAAGFRGSTAVKKTMKTAHFLMLRPSMSIDYDFDCDELIFRLADPLSPPDRVTFHRAAEDALARVPCWGESAVYRAVAALQRTFFDSSSFGRAHS